MRFPLNSRRKTFSTAGTAGIGAALCIVVLAAFQPAFLTKLLLAVGRPLHLARQGAVAGAENAVNGFQSDEDLFEENKRLTQELQKARIKAALFDELRAERGGESASTTLGIAARVLASPPFSPYDTLIVDRGENDGISVGDEVSYDGTVALGTVDTVTGRTARIRLYSSPGTEQSVRVGTRDFLVVAHGIGGGAFQMLVLKEENAARGEGIFLPDGRLLARVETVLPNESDAFALVYAAVPFNLFEIRDALVTPLR